MPSSMSRNSQANADRKGRVRKGRSWQAALRAVQSAAPALSRIEPLEQRWHLSVTPAHVFNFNSTLNDFSAIGNVSVVDGNFYSPVPNGQTAQVLISNGGAFNGSGPVSAAALEGDLGLAAGSLTGLGNGTVTNGSALVMPGSFVASAGDAVSFTADFLTSEPSTAPKNDFAIAVLTGPGGSQIVPLGNATSIAKSADKVSALNASSTGFNYETGAASASISIPSSGAYTLAFAVVNVGDTFQQSGLLLEGVSIPHPIQSFDFGTAASPVAAGYAQVAAALSYSADQGFGWLPGSNAIADYDTGSASGYGGIDPAVTRDFNYTTNGTFAQDLPNGYYDVTVTVGDVRGYGYTNNIALQGAATDVINTGGNGNLPVVTRTYKVAVTNGQLDLNVSSNSSSTYAVLDGLSVALDTTPFAVTSSTPASNGTVNTPVTSATVTFSRPVDAATGQNTNNYSLATPSNGTLHPTSAVVSGSTVTLTFPSQSAQGSYTLSVSGSVDDVGGIPLGSADTIPFSAVTYTVPTAYDFGSASSPVASGYQGVSGDAFNASLGWGWLPSSATVKGYDTGIRSWTTPSADLTEDFNYTTSGTFEVAVPNGNYDVTVTLGDARGWGYPQTVSFGGQLFDTVTTGHNPINGQNPIVTKTYAVGVTNGKLDLGVAAASGGSYAVLDALSFQPDSTVFAVTGSSPANNATVNGPINSISLTYNLPVGGNELTPSSYNLVDSGGVTVSGVSQSGANSVTLSLSGSTPSGSYTLDLSGVRASTGASLASGNNSIAFTVAPLVVPTSFDFGTATSPVASGYTQVTDASAYSPNPGYGWTSGTIASYDTSNTTYTSPAAALTEDFNYTTAGTFAVDVPHSGLYNVTLTLGDARNYSYPQNVSFQGSQIDSVTTGGGNPAVITKTYSVYVAGTQLDVGVSAASGGTYAVLDGLSFTPDNSSFAVTSSSPANGGSATGAITSMTVTFDHMLGASGSQPSNYVLTDSQGISVSGVVVNGYTATLTFSSGLTPGSYSLSLAGVKDVTGASLSSSTIAFSDVPPVVPTTYDFGTSASPVASGYTRVTDTTGYNVSSGYGWQSGATLGSLDTHILTNFGVDPALTQDFNYSTNATFEADVPSNAFYDVTVTVGDARSQTQSDSGGAFRYPQTLSFQGAATDTFTTGGVGNVAIVTRTYVVAVQNGQPLTVGIAAASGGTYGIIDALSFSQDNSAFAISGSTPGAGSTTNIPLSQMTVTFNHPLGSGAAVASNYTLTDPNQSQITITNAVVNGQTVTLSFASQSTAGSYSLAVGSAVHDALGNSLGSGNTIGFSLANGTAPYKFDFGTTSSPVAGGWTQVSDQSGFNSTAGFGWLNAGGQTVAAYDTQINSFTTPAAAVTRDFNYTKDDTFAVNLANGTYQVTLTLGDAQNYTYAMGVNLEGGAVTDTVNTGGSNGAIVNKTYTVTVVNNQLTVEISNAGGNSWGVIDGLQIVAAG